MATVAGPLNADDIVMNQPQRPTFAKKDDEQRFNLLRLAGAHRIFARLDYDSGGYTNISARDAYNPNFMWFKPQLAGNKTLTVAHLQQVDLDGNVVGGFSPGTKLYDPAAFAIHKAIYVARPDVGGIAQCCSPGTRALAMIDGGNLEQIMQDSCNFYKQSFLSPLSDFTMSALGKHNGEQVAKRLSDGRVLILANRGALTIGNSIDTALANFVKVENLAKCQLLAHAAARARGDKIVPMEKDVIEFTAKLLGTDEHSWIHSMPPFQDLERDGSLDYLWG